MPTCMWKWLVPVATLVIGTPCPAPVEVDVEPEVFLEELMKNDLPRMAVTDAGLELSELFYKQGDIPAEWARVIATVDIAAQMISSDRDLSQRELVDDLWSEARMEADKRMGEQDFLKSLILRFNSSCNATSADRMPIARGLKYRYYRDRGLRDNRYKL